MPARLELVRSAAVMAVVVAAVSCASLAGLDDYARGDAAGGMGGQGASGTGGGGGSAGAGGSGGSGGSGGRGPVTASLDWVELYTGAGDVFGTGLALDALGDVAACGHFIGELLHEGSALPNVPTDFDTFVRRRGAQTFLVTAEGAGANFCGGVAARTNETVLVGSYDGLLTLPGGRVSAVASEQSVYATTLNQAGVAAQPSLFTNFAGNDVATAVAEMPTGVVIGGELRGRMGAALQTANATGSEHDAFVVRLFAATEWLHHIDDEAGDTAQLVIDIAASRATGLVVSGGVTSSPINVMSPQPIGMGDRGFVLAQDAMGNERWARFAEADSVQVRGVAVDSSDDSVVVVGRFTGSLDVAGLAEQAVDGIDGFIVKLDADGDPQWLRTVAGPGDQLGFGVSVDDLGQIYAVGQTTGNVTLDGDLLVVDRPSGWLLVLAADGSPELGTLVTASVSASLVEVAARQPGSVAIMARVQGASVTLLDQTLVLGEGSEDLLVARLKLE
jgi:hypothetical protein